MLRFGCAAVLLATMLAGCSDSAPEAQVCPEGRIDGAVLDHLLRPYAETPVHLVEEDVWTNTTQLGGFSFICVPPGFHTVEADIPGIGVDRELLTVDNGTERVILQVWNLPDPEPYVSELVHRARVQVAEPGAMCESCRWAAQLHDEKPVAAVFVAVWEPEILPDVETHLEINLYDEDGNPFTQPLDIEDERPFGDGRQMIRAFVPGEAIHDGAQRFIVDVKFAEENPVPHIDFRMESFLYLHYGMTAEAEVLLG